MTYYTIKPKFKFYPDEIRDILLALGVLTLAFWFLMSGFPSRGHLTLINLVVAFLSVVIAFFLHEMAHKYMAFKYGYPAAFKAWKLGLLIAFFSSFVGFLFAAPGAVYIYGFPSKSENGKISAAGPATNLSVGFALLILAILLPPGLLPAILFYISSLNFFLAFFNLLPIGPMDGLKILYWNVTVYAIMLIASIGGLVIFYVI